MPQPLSPEVMPKFPISVIPPHFHSYLVEGLIDSFVVVGLDGAKVWLDQLEVAIASEEGDTARVIEAGGENKQQVVDEQGLVVEVEL